MEPQNQPIQNPQLMQEPAKKCKHLPIVIVLVILAVSGIGFGGYEFWQNTQKDTKLANLNNQIADLSNQIEELKTKITAIQDDDQVDIEDTEKTTPELIGLPHFEVIDNVFYVKNQDGEILAFEDELKIKDDIFCDLPWDVDHSVWNENSAAKCTVVTVDGEDGWIVYYADNHLEYGIYDF